MAIPSTRTVDTIGANVSSAGRTRAVPEVQTLAAAMPELFAFSTHQKENTAMWTADCREFQAVLNRSILETRPILELKVKP